MENCLITIKSDGSYSTIVGTMSELNTYRARITESVVRSKKLNIQLKNRIEHLIVFSYDKSIVNDTLLTLKYSKKLRDLVTDSLESPIDVKALNIVLEELENGNPGIVLSLYRDNAYVCLAIMAAYKVALYKLEKEKIENDNQ